MTGDVDGLCISCKQSGFGITFESLSPEALRNIRQNMVEYLRNTCPQIYGDLKDEPDISS